MSRNFPLRDKLAAALAIIAGVPYEHRKLMTADQIISLFQFDHDPIPHAAPFNGPAVHWNCTPRLINGESLAGIGHREKTKTDVSEIYKTRRISAAHEEFRQRLLAKGGQAEAPPKKERWRDRKARLIAARSQQGAKP